MGSKESDIFPIFDNGDFEKLGNVRVPILAFFGEKEDTLVCSAQKDLEIIAPHLKNEKSETSIIENADHTYFGKEDEMARAIIKWICDIRFR